MTASGTDGATRRSRTARPGRVPEALGHRAGLQRAQHGRGDPAPHAARSSCPLDREFIVVDDGSDDGTDSVLTQLGDSTVKIVTHAENRGKGAAIRTGLEHVTGDLVLIQDADLEYDPEDWPRLLAPMLKGRAQGRLRLADHRRAPQHALPALGRQQDALARHEPALQHDALGHGDVLQALRPRGAARDHAAARTGSTSSRRSRPRCCGRASASTRCRSRTRAASSTRARRSPGATASPRCTRSSSTASSSRWPWPRPPRWAAVVVNYEAGAAAHRVRRRRCSPTTPPAGRPRSSSSTTARPTARSRSCDAAFPEVTGHPARARTSATAGPRTSGSRRPARRSSRC